MPVVMMVSAIIQPQALQQRETGNEYASSNPFKHAGDPHTRPATTAIQEKIIVWTLIVMGMAVAVMMAHRSFLPPL